MLLSAPMNRPRLVLVALGIIVGILIVLGLVSSILVDWAWFSSLGYDSVFLTTLTAKLALFAIVLVVSTAVLWINGVIALDAARPLTFLKPVNSPWGDYESNELPAVIERFLRRLPWKRFVGIAAIVVGFFVAVPATENWSTVLGYLRHVPYGKPDPLFGNDLSFYLFSLPFLVAIKDWLVSLIVLSAILIALIYFASGEIQLDPRRRGLSRAPLAHGSILLAIFFVIEAFAFFLARYDLLYGDNGVVVGAGYTAVHISLPLLDLLIALSVAAAIACLVNIRIASLRVPLLSLAIVFGTSFVFSPIASALIQRLYVKPNELQLESPYLRSNIASTREAYALGNVVVKPFSAEQTLTAQSLADNRSTIDNIRLWDWQPLLDTYAQLQEIRTYYKFFDADIDRYVLGGRDQQVMLSARELDQSRLPSNAQTWVNQHVLYTHGNGVVMSPVTQFSPDGLPLLYLQNIPPDATGGPPITEPRIYFGEANAPYVIVKGSTPEFDYPRGTDNVYRAYDGKDGVAVGGFAKRLLFAWYFGDLNILLSEYIRGDSKIMIRRNIQERVRALAPFLSLDHDPYMVVSGGRLYWIQDAYTTSAWFPYSQPLEDESANYIRNSVKVVIDAYNGTTDLYIADPKDPIVATWRRIFPVLFKPFDAMPSDLRRHVRYPEDLFLIQAQLYRAYHMDAPEVFYNREDLWQFPRVPNELDDNGDGTTANRMSPYYINMRLPGEARTEFVLLLPMVPASRENMIAWLAARCDPDDYGKLIVYTFPKERLVYGPYQVEALINQNTEVSQQFTLWNQSGSRVIRGNLLVVPIENSILYVTPVYLRAQSGQMPELKRVIAVYGDRVVMEETLAGALAALFKSSGGAITGESAPGTTPAGPPTTNALSNAASAPSANAASAALAHYDRAIAKLKAGDWAGFGQELDSLRPLLQQLNQQRPSAPKPPPPK